VKNRLIRSATFEGMCDENGVPGNRYINLYKKLAYNNIGVIITGFTAVSNAGRAMQPGQAMLYNKDNIKSFKRMTEVVGETGTKIIMQLAHTGRQTIKEYTKEDVLGVSDKRSFYFGGKVKHLETNEVYIIINEFVNAAMYAKESGFDGVQLHAAHGYLIHQFILGSINKRQDEFGIAKDINIGVKFLSLIIDKIRERCGVEFVILVKISGSDDYYNKFSIKQFEALVRFLESKKIDGIEISYGTMDYPLNIIRGDINNNAILRHNYFFKKRDIKSILGNLRRYILIYSKRMAYKDMYNVEYAKIAKKITNIPIISVGGFRKGKDIKKVIADEWCDFVSLSRPFICESDFGYKLMNNSEYVSKCINCNLCLIMCDSKNGLRCYRKIL